MKIIHVSTVHARDDIRIFAKECTTLSKMGWDVRYMVADGSVNAIKDNIKIIDTGKRSKNRIFRILFNTHKAIFSAIKEKPNFVHFHDPELMLAIWPLLLFRKWLKIKIIYDIHENYRELLKSKAYIPNFLRKAGIRIFQKIEDFICKRVDGLVVPQPSMQKQFSKINPNCVLLQNFVDLTKFNDVSNERSRPILFHAGTLTWARGFQNMIDVANALGNRADFYVAGQIESDQILNNIGYLKYLGVLDYDEALDWYRTSNIGIILYNNVGQYYMASAVKCYEYMAAGMPVIMPDFGEWPAFNEESKCGINVDVADSKKIAQIILDLFENNELYNLKSEGAKKYVQSNGSWQSIEHKLTDLYVSLS